MLIALVSATPDDDALIVATDRRGFPVVQTIVSRPRDLPHALMVGRHIRCALAITNDHRLALRHLLLTISPGQHPYRLRGYDFGGILKEGKPVESFSARGHVALGFGRTCLYVLPGGESGRKLLGDDPDEAFMRLLGVSAGEVSDPFVPNGPVYPESTTARPEPRGCLQLRSTKRGVESHRVRELEVDSNQLQRGVLIGRRRDLCSLSDPGRNLSRTHALVVQEDPRSLLVYDLASTNGVRPGGLQRGASHPVVRATPEEPCMLGHFELSWVPQRDAAVH